MPRRSYVGEGNPNYGKHHSEEVRAKISNALSQLTGENSCRWRGDKVKSKALHMYMRNIIPKPDLCEICHSVKPIDLANKTDVYDRNIENWFYLCRKCHNKYDIQKHLKDMSDRRCSSCGTDKTRMVKRKIGLRPYWCYVDGRLVCQKCYDRHRYSNIVTGD